MRYVRPLPRNDDSDSEEDATAICSDDDDDLGAGSFSDLSEIED